MSPEQLDQIIIVANQHAKNYQAANDLASLVMIDHNMYDYIKNYVPKPYENMIMTYYDIMKLRKKVMKK